MALYRVVAGKHRLDDGSYAHAGELVEMEPEEASQFVNKFVEVKEESAPAPAATPTPAQQAQSALAAETANAATEGEE